MASVAIFDLDHTLISVDCSNLWIEYMCSHHFVDNPQQFRKQKNSFDEAYRQGESDMIGYSRLLLSPLKGKDALEMKMHFKRFVHTMIPQYIYPQALIKLKEHQRQGDALLLISASIEELVRPIGEILGFEKDNIIGIKTEKNSHCYTGEVIEPISFAEGKCEHFKLWQQQQKTMYETSVFYSDSINDAPLLAFADKAYCVNPDPKLFTLAQQRGWKVLSWEEKLLAS